MKTTVTFYGKAFTAVISALFVGLVAVAFAQVLFRYVIGYSLYWSEETARYLFVWISFLGAVAALERGAHIGVEVLVEKLPRNIRRYVILFSNISVGLFLLFLTVKGLKMVADNMIQRSPALRVPMGLVYLAIPVGAVLMGIHVFFQILRQLRVQA